LAVPVVVVAVDVVAGILFVNAATKLVDGFLVSLTISKNSLSLLQICARMNRIYAASSSHSCFRNSSITGTRGVYWMWSSFGSVAGSETMVSSNFAASPMSSSLLMSMLSPVGMGVGLHGVTQSISTSLRRTLSISMDEKKAQLCGM